MTQNKAKFALWITPETKHQVEAIYTKDNCASQSEFIEKAVVFYLAYLNTKNTAAFLPEVLSTMLSGTLDMFADRMGSVLFKLAIEQNICNHIIAADTDMDYQTYQQIRGKSVREIKSTNGRINFKEVLQEEKSV